MKHLIEQHFNGILFLGLLAGLFLPGLETLPKYTALGFISAVIFFSCARISVADLRGLNAKSALRFYGLRFVLFPAVAYALAQAFLPADYAIAVLLLALMPVGVSSTAIATLTGGNPAFSLSATVITSLLAPLMIPLMMGALATEAIAIDTTQLLITLCLSVFCPTLLYFLAVRPVAVLRAHAKNYSQSASTLLISGMTAVVVALERETFFANPTLVLQCTLGGAILYALFYAIGWFSGRATPANEKRTYAACSGVNNVSLGAGLAAMYFSPTVVLFAVLSEIPWILAVAVFKRFCEKEPKVQSL